MPLRLGQRQRNCDVLAGALLNQMTMDHAATAARFCSRPQPSRPITPKPAAKSGRAAGLFVRNRQVDADAARSRRIVAPQKFWWPAEVQCRPPPNFVLQFVAGGHHGPAHSHRDHRPGAAACLAHVPWSECSDEQRLDVHNGLLLSALWDAAFDKGLVSFADDGRRSGVYGLAKLHESSLRWNRPRPFTASAMRTGQN